MAVSEYELDAILTHCRSLFDAAAELDAMAETRAEKAQGARAEWEGPFHDDFVARFNHEAHDLAGRASRFRSEADDWADIWAETVNELNRQRREDAVDQISSERGLGESFVDVFVGDDSGDQVRAYQPVSVPTSASRYAATGGLETF